MQFTNDQAPRFETTVRVRWSEGDRQGIAFNGSYLEYLEIAQSEYFRNLGYSIYTLGESGFFDTVIVNTQLTFVIPVKVDEIITLRARVTALGTTSMNFEVAIFNQSNKLTTTITAVYVGYNQATERKMNIPDDIRRLITEFENTGMVLPLSSLPELNKHLDDR